MDTIVVFGEAKKGRYAHPTVCTTTADLYATFGEALPETEGICVGIQTLLFSFGVCYVRVRQEGLSHSDYMRGLFALRKDPAPGVVGILLPGMSDPHILASFRDWADAWDAFLLIRAVDLHI